MDNEWTEYMSKYGEVLFLYNKRTGEHKWPDKFASVSVNIGPPQATLPVVHGKIKIAVFQTETRMMKVSKVQIENYKCCL